MKLPARHTKSDVLSLLDALRRGVSGGVSTADEVLARFSYDFGRRPEAAPAAVVRARSERDVVHVLKTSRAMGVPVSVRGAGHSCGGQTLCPGGVVLLNQCDDGDVRVDDQGRVEVEGRLTWNALDARLGAVGRAPAVLTDYLDLTVGGTLSVGGYGLRSITHGAQADHVERLRVVLPDGSATWCSPRHEAALFDGALSGLGHVGIIERVVMRTIPCPRQSHLVRFAHRGLDDLATALEGIDEVPTDAPALFSAFSMDGRTFSEFGVEADGVEIPLPRALHGRTPAERLTVAEHPICVHASRVRWLSRHAGARALWSDWFFDHAGLRAFLSFIEPRLRGDLGRYLGTCYFLISRRAPGAHRAPLAPDALPHRGAAFGVGTYFFVPMADAAGLTLVREALRAFRDRAIESGGRPYRYGCDELDDDACRRVYGDAYARAVALRRALDPEGLLGRDHG